MIKNIFDPLVTNELVDRINQLTPSTTPLWGKMSVDQMLAHCNVMFEMVYDDKFPKPNILMKFILRSFVKPMVVGDKPYPKNSPTAKEFKITDQKNFEKEKERLINYINQTQKLGETYFDGRDYRSFGKMTKKEWNTMFYKHLNHHLTQFGV